MCGRFVRSSSLRSIAEVFGLDQPDLSFEPSYNVAPTQKILIINNEGRKQIVSCRWGYVPSWAKEIAIGNRMINARAETVADKSSFRGAFRHRRCLVPADGFYEWAKLGTRKQPWHFRRPEPGS